jgi:hypothetical protein
MEHCKHHASTASTANTMPPLKCTKVTRRAQLGGLLCAIRLCTWHRSQFQLIHWTSVCWLLMLQG